MASLRRWTCKVGEDYEGLDAKDGKLTAVDMQGRRRLRGPRRKGWQAYGGGHARSAKTTRASTQRMASLRRWTCKVGEDYEGLDAKDGKITAVDMQVGEDYEGEGLDAKDGKLTAVDMQGRRRLRGPRREGLLASHHRGGGWQAYGGGHAGRRRLRRRGPRREGLLASHHC